MPLLLSIRLRVIKRAQIFYANMSILAAIDVEQMPQQPITIGYDLAATYDEDLVVMYVMTEDRYDEWKSNQDEMPEEFRTGGRTPGEAINSATNKVADAVDETLDTYDRERVETRSRIGVPADEILAAAEEIDPRFIVVGGRKRSVVKQAIFGSVSQEIVRDAEQPVVTIMEETG